MSLFKDERELVSKSLSPKLKELNYNVRVGVRLRGKHQKLKTEEVLSREELNIKHPFSPDIDILYWDRDYSREPELHAVEVKYYRYDKTGHLHPPIYDGVGEALLLCSYGVDYVHLWHFFDPMVSNDEYSNHKTLLETAIDKINIINYNCEQLSKTFAITKEDYTRNSLKYDDDAKVIRTLIKRSYRIVAR